MLSISTLLWRNGFPFLLPFQQLYLFIYFWLCSVLVRASLIAQLVKNLPAVQETQVKFLGQEDLLEKEMATTYLQHEESLLQHRDFSLVVVCKLSFPAPYGFLVPQSGIELVSYALEDRFLITGPWEKSFFFGLFLTNFLELHEIFLHFRNESLIKYIVFKYYFPFCQLLFPPTLIISFLCAEIFSFVSFRSFIFKCLCLGFSCHI